MRRCFNNNNGLIDRICNIICKSHDIIETDKQTDVPASISHAVYNAAHIMSFVSSLYMIKGVATLMMTFWTSEVGLFIGTCTFGFFSASLGPTLCESLFIIVGQKQFNICYGMSMLLMGIGWTLGAFLSGSRQKYILLCL